MAEEHKKRHKNNNEIKTTFSSKFVVEKNGKRMEYSSLDEMPADVREFHEEIQAILDRKIPEHIQKGDFGMSKTTTTTQTTYHFKGKDYKSLEDIPDEITRAKMKAIEHMVDGRSPKTLKRQKVLLTPDGQAREIVEEPKKVGMVWCPGCGNQIKPKKKLFGKYKCPKCKMKWDPDDVV